LKRFARDTVFHWNLRSALKVRNATPKCLNYDFADDPEGRFVETIFAAQNQLEREQNRRQVVQKMKARLEMGHWCFPSLPLGYKHFKASSASNSIPTPSEPLASIVREALEGYASGRFQEQIDVQRFFKEKRLKGSRAIYLEQVKRILVQSFFYAGYVEYKEWEVGMREGLHEGIISLVTHEKIQERLIGKVRTHVKRFLNPDFPLRKFVICAECRKPMTASWSTTRSGDKKPYYRCNGSGCSFKNKSIPRDVMTEEFELILSKIKPNKEVLELTKEIVKNVWLKKEGEIGSKRQQVANELKELEMERRKLFERLTKASGDKVVALYEDRLGEIAESELVLKSSIVSLDEHKPNIETALDIVFDFLGNPLVQWQKGDIHRKKLVINLIFEENLAYNKNSGFETATLSLPLRVFTLPKAQKSRLVEMGGIEPPCKKEKA
jgi:site-specific DNA recombinase